MRRVMAAQIQSHLAVKQRAYGRDIPIGVAPMHLFKSPMFRICEPFVSSAQNDAEYPSRYGEAAYGRSRRRAFGYKRPLLALAPMEDAAVVEASRYDSEHAA
jgi:hypothetical protein